MSLKLPSIREIVRSTIKQNDRLSNMIYVIENYDKQTYRFSQIGSVCTVCSFSFFTAHSCSILFSGILLRYQGEIMKEINSHRPTPQAVI